MNDSVIIKLITDRLIDLWVNEWVFFLSFLSSCLLYWCDNEFWDFTQCEGCNAAYIISKKKQHSYAAYLLAQHLCQ